MSAKTKPSTSPSAGPALEDLAAQAAALSDAGARLAQAIRTAAAAIVIQADPDVDAAARIYQLGKPMTPTQIATLFERESTPDAIDRRFRNAGCTPVGRRPKRWRVADVDRVILGEV